MGSVKSILLRNARKRDVNVTQHALNLHLIPAQLGLRSLGEKKAVLKIEVTLLHNKTVRQKNKINNEQALDG